MDEKNFSSITTLRNLCTDIEKRLREKHEKMTVLRNEFLILRQQHADLTSILESMEGLKK